MDLNILGRSVPKRGAKAMIYMMNKTTRLTSRESCKVHAMLRRLCHGMRIKLGFIELKTITMKKVKGRLIVKFRLIDVGGTP